MEALTTIQGRVLEALRRRADQGEPAPTYRELCAEFNWASTGTVRDHLRALVRKGYLELTGRHRQLRLREEHPSVARVPLVGRVVAGLPVISDENIEQRIPVPAAWIRKGTFFALRVAGDSMRDAGILDGDQVIVRQRSVASDGDVVIATLEGETTIKRLRTNGSSMTLVAENPQYRSIEVRAEEAIIQGVVVGLMRAYHERGAATDRLARRRARGIAPEGASA
jgi:repressor LexA